VNVCIICMHRLTVMSVHCLLFTAMCRGRRTYLIGMLNSMPLLKVMREGVDLCAAFDDLIAQMSSN